VETYAASIRHLRLHGAAHDWRIGARLRFLKRARPSDMDLRLARNGSEHAVLVFRVVRFVPLIPSMLVVVVVVVVRGEWVDAAGYSGGGDSGGHRPLAQAIRAGVGEVLSEVEERQEEQ
jgi:hypothetical protein